MPAGRETHTIRVFGSSEDVWVDLEILDKWIIKRGKGPDFQKTVLYFNEDSPNRKTSTKLVEIEPDGEVIEITIVDELIMKRGKGPDFQRVRIKFNNTPEADRIVHVVRIDAENDPEKFVEVERIDRFIMKRGKGPDFQRTKYLPNSIRDDE